MCRLLGVAKTCPVACAINSFNVTDGAAPARMLGKPTPSAEVCGSRGSVLRAAVPFQESLALVEDLRYPRNSASSAFASEGPSSKRHRWPLLAVSALLLALAASVARGHPNTK